MEQFANTSVTTLNGSISSGVTSLVVASAALFPGVAQFRLLIENELLLVTVVAGTTFTVTRGVEGTTAASHADGVAVTHILTAGALEQLKADAGGGGAPSNVLVMRDGGVASGNVYTSWATLMTARALIEGPVTLVVDFSITGSLTIPAGVWNLSGNTRIVGYGLGYIQVPTGAQLLDASEIINSTIYLSSDSGMSALDFSYLPFTSTPQLVPHLDFIDTQVISLTSPAGIKLARIYPHNTALPVLRLYGASILKSHFGTYAFDADLTQVELYDVSSIESDAFAGTGAFIYVGPLATCDASQPSATTPLFMSPNIIGSFSAAVLGSVLTKTGDTSSNWVTPTFSVLIYRPGGVAAGRVFTDIAALQVARSAIDGPVTIVMDGSITAPVDLTGAGVWQLGGNTRIVGYRCGTLLIPVGVQLVDPHEFENVGFIDMRSWASANITFSYPVKVGFLRFINTDIQSTAADTSTPGVYLADTNFSPPCVQLYGDSHVWNDGTIPVFNAGTTNNPRFELYDNSIMDTVVSGNEATFYVGPNATCAAQGLVTTPHFFSGNLAGGWSSAAVGTVLTKTGDTTATWEVGAPPNGAAGGGLSGTYPNPSVNAGVAPGGAAGGALAGTYPNPTLAATPFDITGTDTTTTSTTANQTIATIAIPANSGAWKIDLLIVAHRTGAIAEVYSVSLSTTYYDIGAGPVIVGTDTLSDPKAVASGTPAINSFVSGATVIIRATPWNAGSTKWRVGVQAVQAL